MVVCGLWFSTDPSASVLPVTDPSAVWPTSVLGLPMLTDRLQSVADDEGTAVVGFGLKLRLRGELDELRESSSEWLE